jgi:hypothetical protein
VSAAPLPEVPRLSIGGHGIAASSYRHHGIARLSIGTLRIAGLASVFFA